ncbi:MAG: glycosyltransferase family 2 protein [Candidatus Coatesbacteria bacterium]|nr:glycosyltransferase family 2 protein [Candidatus Coatesbacteria bacterium]
MQPISAIVIAGEEEHQIGLCLQSISWLDEIIVVCSSRNDSTIDIAKEYTNKVYFREWSGYAQQKEYAISLTKHEWILSIDADEIIPQDTKETIKELQSESMVNGYYFKRKNYFLGKWIKHCDWYPDFQPRLFKKSYTSIIKREVHESFEISPPVIYLNADIIHNTHPDLKRLVNKINTYSSLASIEKTKSVNVSVFKAVLHGLSAFLNHFIARGGWREGKYGFLVSYFHGFTCFLTYLKAWERKRSSRGERGRTSATSNGAGGS